jgi:hypothetical protein
MVSLRGTRTDGCAVPRPRVARSSYLCPMGADEAWQQPRLIPTSGITGTDEAERRAASAFLAVLPAVREYSRTLLGGVNAPAGNIETFVDVPFTLGETVWRPDGLIRVTRGSKSWVALVEVKTSDDLLIPEQVEAYLDIARLNKFDALITISNQIATAGTHPTAVRRRKRRRVQMHHWSWAYLVSAAVQQKEHRGVSDPDQAWILGELIRYLEHPKSGALEAVGGDPPTEEEKPDDAKRPERVRMRRSSPLIPSWLVVSSVALILVATAGALGIASSFDEPGSLRAAKVGVAHIPDSCENGATKPFTPTSIDIQDVRQGLPILALARDDNDVPGVPPIKADHAVAWDRSPGGLKPGSPRGNVLLNAHTGLNGASLGEAMLAKVGVGDVIRLRDSETHLCYRVTKRVEVSAYKGYKPFYADDGPPQFAFLVCSGERLGPGEWTKRTIWFGSPIGTDR